MADTKITFTNAEIVMTFHNLTKLNNLRGVKFAYLMDKNRSKLEEEVKRIKEATKEEGSGVKEMLNKVNESFEPYMIDIRNVPEDITWEQYSIIRKFIKPLE